MASAFRTLWLESLEMNSNFIHLQLGRLLLIIFFDIIVYTGPLFMQANRREQDSCLNWKSVLCFEDSYMLCKQQKKIFCAANQY